MASSPQSVKRRTAKKARKLKLIECPRTLKRSPEKLKPNFAISLGESTKRKKSKDSTPEKKLKQISPISQGKTTPKEKVDQAYKNFERLRGTPIK